MDMSIQAELSDVMSKVNAWSLAKETDLLAVSAKHKSFLDTHSGAFRPAMSTAPRVAGGVLVWSLALEWPEDPLRGASGVENIRYCARVAVFRVSCWCEHGHPRVNQEAKRCHSLRNGGWVACRLDG
jgi:hypothetical protein